MRIALLFVLAFLFSCSSQPKMPTKTELVSELQSSTVALVRLSYELNLESDDNGIKIKLDPFTRPYCSGVWISSSSFVTAHHCVDGMPMGEELTYVLQSDVFDSDGVARRIMKVKIAKLVDVDPEHDLAVLRALVPPPHEVAALSIEPIEAGMIVHSMGHPRAMWFSYSSGDVAAVRRMHMPTELDDPIAKNTLWVQSTVPISAGNSGGGLFDSHGHLVGVCSRNRADGQGLNFYIHRDHIAAFLSKQATL